MKFIYLHVYNHPILQDLKISFVNGEGIPYDTVILAGENGSGKSTLLNLLYSCTSINFSKSTSERREYEFLLNDKEQALAKENFGSRFQGQQFESNRIKIEQNFALKEWEQVKITFISVSNDIFEVVPWDVVSRFSSSFRSIFSDVEINFNAQQISSVTSQEIDIGIETQKKSNENLATEITQLLVDISSSDASDLQSWIMEHPGEAPPREKISFRMDRFTRAFKYMFPTKTFYKIENENGKKSVNFIEHGNKISLNDFSSGEKQIVFRGSFLLRDRNIKSGSIVYIDEPEISLHPRWQLKILSFYQRLFTTTKGVQESQLFVATHSPFIIHNDNRLNDKVFILEKNSIGKLSIKDSSAEFFNWSFEEIIKDAFKIDFNSTVKRNTVFVEGELDEEYFKSCKELNNRNDLAFDVKWIGRTKPNGTNEFSGKTALNTMLTVCLAHENLIPHKIILYFDNDCNKRDEDYKNVLIRSAPKKQENLFFKKGIESLLKLPEDFEKENFLEIKHEDDGSGGERIIKSINKRKLYQWAASHESAQKIFTKLNQELTLLQNSWK